MAQVTLSPDNTSYSVKEAESLSNRGLAEPPAGLDDINGVWLKDKEASASMDAVCDLMELNKLMRWAIGLIKGIQFKVTAEYFELAVLSGVLWFKIKEKYPMNGEPAQGARRDLRRGGHTGRLQRHPSGRGYLLRLEWGEPLEGTQEEHIYLASPDVLHIDTTMTVRGKPLPMYRTVYRRKA